MNERNLIPITQRSEREQREMRSKGGRNSGETRRRKRSMKAALRELLALPVADADIWNKLSALGIEPDKMDNQTALLAAVFLRGVKSGDVAVLKELRSILGEDSDAERLKLQKRQTDIQERKLEGDADSGGEVTIIDDIGKAE